MYTRVGQSNLWFGHTADALPDSPDEGAIAVEIDGDVVRVYANPTAGWMQYPDLNLFIDPQFHVVGSVSDDAEENPSNPGTIIALLKGVLSLQTQILSRLNLPLEVEIV